MTTLLNNKQQRRLLYICLKWDDFNIMKQIIKTYYKDFKLFLNKIKYFKNRRFRKHIFIPDGCKVMVKMKGDDVFTDIGVTFNHVDDVIK